MITVAKTVSLLDRVRTYLRDSHYSPEFDRVQIAVDNSHVRITGKVSSFYHKQLATEMCRQVSGVSAVCNYLDVEYPEN